MANNDINVKDFIKSSFKLNFVPSLALSAMMDYVFSEEPGGNEWYSFEPETILGTLADKGVFPQYQQLADQILCIAAVRFGQSFIDKEWRLFEKTCAALTGLPVFFYEKQNLPIENVIHAMNIIKSLTKLELSDEVEHYVGCETINDSIFWHPNEEVFKYTIEALGRIKDHIGLSWEETKKIILDVNERFTALSKEDIDKIELADDSIVDQMCARIIVSLNNGAELARIETAVLNAFTRAKQGDIDGITDVADIVDPNEAGVETILVSEDTVEDVYNELDDIVSDDLPTSVETFTDGVKQAFSMLDTTPGGIDAGTATATDVGTATVIPTKQATIQEIHTNTVLEETRGGAAGFKLGSTEDLVQEESLAAIENPFMD